jgi:hypothetical protein
MRFVPAKTADQQAAVLLHRGRERLVRQRTALVNALRAHLAEFGIIAPQGLRNVGKLIVIVRDEDDARLPYMACQVLQVLAAQIEHLETAVAAIEKQLMAWHKSNPVSQRLATIPGIGPIIATAIAATVVEPTAFRSGREFAAGHRSRSNDEDSVRGPHQGQQSLRTASTGRTHDCKRPVCCTLKDLLPGGGHPHMTSRRDFITLLGGAAAWPIAARAQQAKPGRIGFLRVGPPPPTYIGGFREGLREQGLLEGRDVVIEFALAQNAAQIPKTAAELASSRVGMSSWPRGRRPSSLPRRPRATSPWSSSQPSIRLRPDSSRASHGPAAM